MPDLSGIKEKVPEAELSLDAKRHVICVRGNKGRGGNLQICPLNVNGPVEHPGGVASPCSICLCEVEDSYHLSACEHEFCRSCLVDQLESAIKSRDPL